MEQNNGKEVDRSAVVPQDGVIPAFVLFAGKRFSFTRVTDRGDDNINVLYHEMDDAQAGVADFSPEEVNSRFHWLAKLPEMWGYDGIGFTPEGFWMLGLTGPN